MWRAICSGKMPKGGGYYAVKTGRNTGIYRTWDECQEQVKGYARCSFKKFSTENEALDFVGGESESSSSYPSTSTSINDAGSSSSNADSWYSSGQPWSQGDRNGHSSARSSSSWHSSGGPRSHPNRQRFSPYAYSSSYSTSAYSTSNSSGGTASDDEGQQNEVYVDGCCFANGRRGAKAGGGVFWGPNNPYNCSFKLDTSLKHTNQTAEIEAAIKAVEQAKERNMDSLTIRTDSQFTINCMTQWVSKWERNGWKTATGEDVVHKDRLQHLSQLSRQVKVQWSHVPGHSDVYGNEEADRLAKDGAMK